ncbi:protease-4 [Azospirillum lipoferum]|uniref:Signal peptide peptidase SppA n=1 Tax=Azospirillum lipoferum TaxID=193 RepID=A0A5A9GUM0_AZOLI|nr:MULTISPECIES: signal peptide peptidase SppA [Azospirillum]KAA0597274.1 signal peptide peptidase SppA [Azospirillum lipoferum]MCP1608794.1 protease-4 [Azospirillum lipoferum]MDW5535891.1 signal peptide peptidase SppA [Azospirillum sp. NL1]
MAIVRFFVRLFALIGLLLVAGAVTVVVLAVRHEPTLPDAVVLELDLTKPLAESDDGKFGSLFEHQPTLREVLDALDGGRRDPKVKGVLARFGDDSIGFAQTQELRTAIERFRASGRFTVAFAEEYGGAGAGNRSYLLASAFDEVWLQPLGTLGITGLSAELPFARDAFDQLGVQPSFAQREEYKSFAETFTKSGMTPANREMMEALVADLGNQLVDGIAKSRRLAPAAVRTAMDKAPLLSREALEQKFVDRLGYADEARDEALKRAGAGAEMVDPADYLSVAGSPNDTGPTIALIHAVGTITGGESGKPTPVGVSAGSETIVKAIEEAAEDPDVRAILFRIDSGGGAVSASEAIRRALVKARQSGKPVIASMGDTAASGGYWIALAADRIVASPATVTGSIGVVAGKFAIGGLSDKLGIHWDGVRGARNAGMWSPLRPFDDSESERLNAIIDDTYANFLQRVAEARRMTPEQARGIAKGRVWTGAQARELGLVDDLGGQEQALTLARTAAGLSPDAPVTLAPYPPPKSVTDQILDLVSRKGELVGALAAAAELRPLLTQLRPLLALTQSDGVQARMPSMSLGR